MPDAMSPVAPYIAFLTAPSADTNSYHAMQEDTAVAAVDWQVFRTWTDDDPDFSGVITIRDGIGAYVATSTWITPTDQAADHSLTRIGWHRTGPWGPDRLGRRDAPVARIPTQ